ncbi:MAG TPA: NAD(P)/FAD-dependent oxidoreductase [Gaiellaceae bacterium]
MRDAVVVGGGIAGLSAAWALRDRDVVLLEASDRLGGRIRSDRRGAYWLNFGAHVFAGPGSATDRLLREVGVEAVPIPGVLTALELDGRIVSRGRVETYPLRLPLTWRDRLAFARVGVRLRIGVARYDRLLRASNRGQTLAFEGDRTFAEWLGPVPPAVDAILRPTIQRSSGEPEDVAAGYGIGYFHLVWDRSGGLARGILGGPGALVDAVASQLGSRTRTLVPVREVVQDADGVRVIHDHGEERACQVILATPAHVSHEIARDLPADTRESLAGISYGRYVVASFLTGESGPTPWDRVYAIATARRSFNMLFNMASVLRCPGLARERGGSLMAYSGARLAEALWDEKDATVRDTYLADLDAVLPGALQLVQEVVVHRWSPGLPYVRPGRHRLQPALERPLGRVHLAGDYLGTRYTDTAIATGTAAAATVRTLLRPGSDP